MVETAFSSIKRLFGEHVTARKYANMAQEMVLKASLLHNLFTAMAQTI